MMDRLQPFSPVWPETLLFWGAGASMPLGFPGTDKQAEFIGKLAAKEPNAIKRVSGAFEIETIRQSVADLLILLGDESSQKYMPLSQKEREAATRQFPNLTAEQQVLLVQELRSQYDWMTLRHLIQACPGHSGEKGLKLQDLFNLIDMHMQSGHGFHVLDGENDIFISPQELAPARNALVMLIQLLFFNDYQKLIREKKNMVEEYVAFAEILAKLMQEEGLRFVQDGFKLEERDFYLFSYAVVSMNWDPVLLWLIFNAHRKANDPRLAPHVGEPAVPMKLFHDMGHFMGVRRIDSDRPDVWYPLNESVAQRLNDADHASSRRVRLGKFYFPHGCMGWRECPSCGKLTMYLGDEWKDSSVSLFAPPLLPSLSADWIKSRSVEEEAAKTAGRVDCMHCVHCGTMMEMHHTSMLMQSNFKGKPAPFVEEIQRDMRIALEKAKHIVLFGYSLPPDDVNYRSLLAARQLRTAKESEKLFCSVVVGKIDDAPDRWLEGTELENFIVALEKQGDSSGFVKAIKAAREIIGPERVRGYARGIPNVFCNKENGSADKAKIAELLYPQKIFPNNMVLRKTLEY